MAQATAKVHELVPVAVPPLMTDVLTQDPVGVALKGGQQGQLPGVLAQPQADPATSSLISS